MPVTPIEDTNPVFVRQDGTEAPYQDIAGYRFHDYFRRDGWMDAEYETADDMVAAARAAYLGSDQDGIGVRLDVWSGAAWVRHSLDSQAPCHNDSASVNMAAGELVRAG